MSTYLATRAAAAQATLDRFTTMPFAFGKSDCVRLVAYHLGQLGYKPGLSRGGSYSSLKGARAALKRAGFKSIDAALDQLGLERIAPARVLVGDVVKGEGLEPFGAFAIYVGNGRIIGFHEDREGAVVMQPDIPLTAAWRADPKPTVMAAHQAKLRPIEALLAARP